MLNYMTTREAARKWGLTPRRIQALCNEGQVKGAFKRSGIWLIPVLPPRPACCTKAGGQDNNSPITVLSLFSGCGGMDLGFEGDFNVLQESVNPLLYPHWGITKHGGGWVHLPKTRFRTVFANDIRDDAKTAWTTYFEKKGFSPSMYHLDSIVDLVKLHKEGRTKVFPESVDVVTGGFPCQDFSVAGKRLGLNSDKTHDGSCVEKCEAPSIENRGQLYMWMREVVNLTKPKVFVAENVRGLISLPDVKSMIEHDFSTVAGNGYLVVSARVLHAADYGVPQSRERIIFYGFKKSALTERAYQALSQENIPGEYDPYPSPTHGYTLQEDGLAKPVNLHMAFRGLSEPEESLDLSQQKYSKAKYMGKHCQGQSEVRLDSISPTIRSEHHGNIEFRRLSEKNGGQNRDEISRGLPERRLTVRECARIQTFPDDYDFVIAAPRGQPTVSASAAYKIIGNALPPLLGYNIARRLEFLWETYFGDLGK